MLGSQSPPSLPPTETPDPRDAVAAADGRDGAGMAELVRRIIAADQQAIESLYAIFSRGIRFYLCRQLGAQELEDKLHDTFLVVVQALQRGELRDPSKLMAFVRTIVRRQVAGYIDATVRTRRDVADLELGSRVADGRSNPEQNLLTSEKAQIMRDVLRELSARDREILIRFYLHEESQAEICRAMGLTDTQFRLLKSRAKARFGEMGKRKLNRHADKAMRKAAGS